MTYQELIEAGGRLFYTWGPNSGGWAGYVCHDGLVWEARADRGVELGASYTYAAFVERYASRPDLDACAEVLAFVRGELS